MISFVRVSVFISAIIYLFWAFVLMDFFWLRDIASWSPHDRALFGAIFGLIQWVAFIFAEDVNKKIKEE